MPQLIKASNIANNSIGSVVFDSGVANTFNAASLASAVAISANVAAQAVSTFVTLQTQAIANAGLLPVIGTISITDASYNVLDDTAANTNGDYLQITGLNFQSGAIVMVGSSNTALSTTVVNSSTLRAEIPAISSGTYPVYVVNTNGGTAIRPNGLKTGLFPTWITGATLSQQRNGVAFALNLSASSDSNIISYANTTILPVGTNLLANGYFYALANTSANSDTTYTFTAKVTDTELQDSFKEFNITFLNKRNLYTWGQNNQGQLGENDLVYRSSPAQVGSSTDWNWKQIVRSWNNVNTMGIKDDGTLWAWGQADRGQLGLNGATNSPKSSPTQVGALTNWSKVDIGSLQALALKTDGTLWSWGYNGEGQLGINVQGTANNQNRSSPVQIGTGATWVDIGVGNHNIALKSDGTLWSWGFNGTGQLGIGTITARSSPTQIGAGSIWRSISPEGTAAIKNDGTLWMWGSNSSGQLGDNTISNRSSMVQVGTDNNWSHINTGGNFVSSAVKTDGTLWMWGSNASGQLGLNDTVNRSSPVQVGTDTNWSQTANVKHNEKLAVIALKTDNTLWTWGSNTNGDLGLNDTVNRSSPVQLSNIPYWTRPYNFDVGTVLFESSISDFPLFNTNATLTNQTSNADFGLSISATSDSNISYSNTSALPAGTTLLSNGWFYGANSVATDTTYSITIKATDAELQDAIRTFSLTIIPTNGLWALGGFNNSGQLGLNTGTEYRSSPTQVGTLTDWTTITSYDRHTLAIKGNGTLWSWGRGIRNALGHNDQVDRSSPTQVGTNTNWSKIEAGFSHALAIKTDGTLWAWGSNDSGFLGTNNQTAFLSPVQLGSSTWLDVAAGDQTSFAIKTDGTLWAWGLGTSGQLGLPGSITALRRSSPVQVGTDTNWGSTEWGGRIFTSAFATLVVKPNGTLWGWGVNGLGRLGTNSVANASSPVQIGALTNWSYPVISGVSSGNETETGMAICTRTDGTIWSWGSNTFGGQGRNLTAPGFGASSNRFSSPVQIGTDTNWAQGHSKVAIGSYGDVSAIKTDGTLWTWGNNELGQLGQNNKIYRSSPVQLGSDTTWKLVSASERSMMAQRL